MTKKELRKFYLQKRLSLSESEVADLSQRLCVQFFKHIDLSHIKILHTFLPLVQKGEPDTWLIIDELRKGYPAIKISVPKINSGGLMENYFLEDRDQLELSAWGIPEPKQGRITDPKNIDVVLVPLLAYDRIGQRVGYGKGHYDQFLKMCRPDCERIGISFFEPEEKIDDTFEGDELLHRVITSQNVYCF